MEVRGPSNLKTVLTYFIAFSDDLFDDALTTPEPPSLTYNMELKIVDLGDNFHAPEPGTVQFEELSNIINDNVKPLFKKLPNYKELMVQEIKE